MDLYIVLGRDCQTGALVPMKGNGSSTSPHIRVFDNPQSAIRSLQRMMPERHYSMLERGWVNDVEPVAVHKLDGLGEPVFTLPN